MAENLRHRGLEVTVIERNPQVLGPLDIEMAKLIERHLLLKGVQLIFDDGVEELMDNGRTLRLKSGKRLSTDMIILSVGVKPESQLAADAGLTLGVKGAIQVNEHMQTNDSAIYAIGDATQVKDRVHGFDTVVPLAWGLTDKDASLPIILMGCKLPIKALSVQQS